MRWSEKPPIRARTPSSFSGEKIPAKDDPIAILTDRVEILFESALKRSLGKVLIESFELAAMLSNILFFVSHGGPKELYELSWSNVSETGRGPFHV